MSEDCSTNLTRAQAWEALREEAARLFGRLSEAERVEDDSPCDLLLGAALDGDLESLALTLDYAASIADEGGCDFAGRLYDYAGWIRDSV